MWRKLNLNIMKTTREELIDFLNYLHEEAFIDPAMASLADEVLVDTYLKSINSASNESLSVTENEGKKKFTREQMIDAIHESRMQEDKTEDYILRQFE